MAGKFIVVLLIGFGIIVAVVYMDQGQRKDTGPIRQAGRGAEADDGWAVTYLPLKVNQAGVIPIIFATSVLYFPVLIASVYHGQWFPDFVNKYVQNQRSILYMFILRFVDRLLQLLLYGDPVRPRPDGRQPPSAGRLHPRIRPGRPTADYLNDILVRITLPGSLFLAAIALIPTIVLAMWNFQQFPFGGTSILIAVGVALETMKQIESQLMMRHYEGFLR